MWKNFFGAVLVVAIALGIAGYFSFRYLNQKIEERNQEVLNLKKQDVQITIPEGWRREQIAAALQAKGITDANSFLSASSADEGYLFPDTYRFFPNTVASEVVKTMKQNYQNRLNSGTTVSSTQLILASIIEREAKNDSERATIAGVYQNRLKDGMKLEADPTVQYGKDTNRLAGVSNALSSAITSLPDNYKFWSVITQANYTDVLSPYNTYLHDGLPPAPICNPGLKSIQAAQNPENHNYYYFVHRGGQILLSKTLEEHRLKSQ